MSLLLELEKLTGKVALIQLQTDLIELLPDDIDVALVPVKGGRVSKAPSARGPMIMCSYGDVTFRFRDFEQDQLRWLVRFTPNRLKQALTFALMEPELKSAGFVRKTFGNFFNALDSSKQVTGAVASNPDHVISPSALRKGGKTLADADGERPPLGLLVRSPDELYARISVSSPSGLKPALEYVKALVKPAKGQVLTKSFGE